MLERFKVKGFKSISEAEVRFRPLTVVFGPNAVGKSNLVEALLLLSRIVSERTLHEAFDEPLRGRPQEQFAMPKGGIAGLMRQDKASLSFEADLRFHSNESVRKSDTRRLRYRVSPWIIPRTGELAIDDEYLARMSGKWEPKGLPRIERIPAVTAKQGEPENDGRKGGERACLAVRRLGQPGQPRHEELGLSHSLVSNLQYSGRDRYPDFDDVRRELGGWRLYYLDPRVSMRRPQPPSEVYDIGPRGEWIAPFLHRLASHEELQPRFKAVQRALRMAIPSIDSLSVLLDERRGELDIQVRQAGKQFSSRILSEGTLRVLALCALSANPWPNSLIAFEEPENGVHPMRVDVIARLLAALARDQDRRVLITTHSPELLKAIAATTHQGLLPPEAIGFLRAGAAAGHTSFVEDDVSSPIFQDAKIREALKSDDDDRVLEDLFRRGWLDG